MPNETNLATFAQKIVLLDPATGAPYTSMPVTLSGESLTVTVPASVEISNDTGNRLPVSQAVDSTGASITPDSWSHTYGYSGLQQLVTDTATDGTSTWVKTYTYTAGNLTAESKWVRA